MPSKKKSVPVPWDLKEGDDNYLKEPWILKKGKEFITIETNNNNRGNFSLGWAVLNLRHSATN